jgi:nucleotide-binding universal stress UspA family protein
MLHVFRNTPLGRETLMMSAYFAKRCGLTLRVYVPRHDQFLMYFENAIATVELDRAFFRSPGTTREYAEDILAVSGADYSFLDALRYTTRQLPDLPTDVDVMCCPRSISDLSTRIGPGHIGPAVRKIIRNAPFPVLLSPTVSKPWTSIVCFFGGSPNAVQALRCAADISGRSGCPLLLLTHAEGRQRSDLERQIPDDLQETVRAGMWIFQEGSDFTEELYLIPHDALAVIGASGHGLAKEVLFGSRLEIVQSVLPNQLLVVGPKVRLPRVCTAQQEAPMEHRTAGG